MKLKKMTLNINGADRMFIYDPENDTLAAVLRRLGLTGTKVGCGTGVCGACSVILNGKVIRSCTRKMNKVEEYSEVTTIEGIGVPNNPHPVQVAWVNSGAVQCGFCTPGFIVSAYALLHENPRPTREDVRDWFQRHRNVCRCTGYRQIVDAVMLAAEVMRGEKTVEQISYRPDNKSKDYYGKPLVRPAAMGKACGTVDYGDDIELKMPAGTLHVVVVQPRAYSHAKILNIDSSEAEKMPGIVKVITAKDVKGTNAMDLWTCSPLSTSAKVARSILVHDKIRMYGDVVALVAADTKEHARAAAASVKVELEPLPEYTNYLDAAMPEALRIHKNSPNIYAVWPMLKGEGDVPQIIENAYCSVEGSFHSSREPHLSIEGDTVQAYWDPDGVMTIHCKSQSLYWNKGDVAQAIGLPSEKVRLVMNPSGGSFGWSITATSFSLAGIAAMATDMPVALSMSYEEFLHFSGKRASSYSNARLACDENSRIIAGEFDIGIDHGAYSEMGDDLANKVIRFPLFPYSVPEVKVLSRVAYTNHGFGTAYRGYGSPQAYTASEAIIDMLAEKMGMDPFEFRWKNIARPDDTNIAGYPYRDYPMEGMMLKLLPLYEKAVAEAESADTPEKRRGVGIAWGGFNVSDQPLDQCGVALELNPDNTITKYDTWQDLGQGGDVGSLTVTLEALKPMGVTPKRLKLVQNDTGTCPNSGSSASSRSHFMNGKATILAAEKLMDAMKKTDGTYRTYGEMVAEGVPTKYEAAHSNGSIPGLCPIDPITGQGDPSPDYTYALYMAEVEVDTATGKTTVLRVVCVDDVGVIGNIHAVEGQAYGGISHSIGFALSEDYEDVKKHNNMFSCGVPYIKDIPDDITLIHNGTVRKFGPFGSSGASEAFQSAGHMAVVNAIHNACGVRIYEIPARPEKVKAGLDIIKEKGKPDPPKKYYLGPDMYDEIERVKASKR